MPILENNTYVTSMEYSPLIGGFAITLNDGRAAYLTANSLKFDPNVSRTMHLANGNNSFFIAEFDFFFCSKYKASGRKDWRMRPVPALIINIV